MSTILIVEDNELNCDMLSRRLIRKGFQIIIAKDGVEGVNMAISQQPDLILMDMSLPVLSGWEATKQIKATFATSRIPIIALTAHAMASDRDQAIEAGCDDFDTKPIDLERLLLKVLSMLRPGVGRSSIQ